VAKSPVPAVQELARRVAALESELAILRALYRYCHLLDNGRQTELVDLFAPDGVLDVRYVRRTGGPSHREAGHAALARWIASYAKVPQGKQQHLLTAPIIAIEGAGATAESYFTTVEARAGGPAVVAAGRYRDRLARRDGRWRFIERIAEVET